MSGGTLHGVWHVTPSRILASGQFKTVVSIGANGDCRMQTATVCPPVVVNYTQLKFTNCSRHESTQARWVLVASTMVVLGPPWTGPCMQGPRSHGVQGSVDPHFFEYAVHMRRFTHHILSAIPTLTLRGLLDHAVWLEISQIRWERSEVVRLPSRSVVLCWSSPENVLYLLDPLEKNSLLRHHPSSSPFPILLSPGPLSISIHSSPHSTSNERATTLE